MTSEAALLPFARRKKHVFQHATSCLGKACVGDENSTKLTIKRKLTMKKIIFGALASAAMVAGAAPAFALPNNGTVSGTMSVSLIVQPGCSFSNSSASTTSGAIPNAVLDFGTVASGTPAGSGAPGSNTPTFDAVATSAASTSGGGSLMQVTCSSAYTGTNSPWLDLGAGLYPVAGGTQRQMAAGLFVPGRLMYGGYLIQYKIYTDAGRNNEWVAGTPVQLAIPIANVPTPIRAYGRVQFISVPPTDGVYTDLVAMTLYY